MNGGGLYNRMNWEMEEQRRTLEGRGDNGKPAEDEMKWRKVILCDQSRMGW